jgi:hypothetical protein
MLPMFNITFNALDLRKSVRSIESTSVHDVAGIAIKTERALTYSSALIRMK